MKYPGFLYKQETPHDSLRPGECGDECFWVNAKRDPRKPRMTESAKECGEDVILCLKFDIKNLPVKIFTGRFLIIYFIIL